MIFESWSFFCVVDASSFEALMVEYIIVCLRVCWDMILKAILFTVVNSRLFPITLLNFFYLYYFYYTSPLRHEGVVLFSEGNCLLWFGRVLWAYSVLSSKILNRIKFFYIVKIGNYSFLYCFIIIIFIYSGMLYWSSSIFSGGICLIFCCCNFDFISCCYRIGLVFFGIAICIDHLFT